MDLNKRGHQGESDTEQDALEKERDAFRHYGISPNSRSAEGVDIEGVILSASCNPAPEKSAGVSAICGGPRIRSGDLGVMSLLRTNHVTRWNLHNVRLRNEMAPLAPTCPRCLCSS